MSDFYNPLRNYISSFGNNKTTNVIQMGKMVKWIKIVSFLLIIVGVIHLIGTPFVMSLFQDLSNDQSLVFLFMYIGAGFGLLSPGVIALLTLRLVDANKGWTIIMSCSIYTLLLAVFAIVTMTENPFSYVLLILGVLFVVISLSLKKSLANRTT